VTSRGAVLCDAAVGCWCSCFAHSIIAQAPALATGAARTAQGECHSLRARMQVQLPEAVAIVMAPTDPRSKCGIFRLTTPGGMGVIRECHQRGFHTHPRPSTGQEIYELSGHVFLDEGANARFDSIDLR
jgi:hypothetical protein